MKALFVTTCYPTANDPQYCVFLEQQARALNGLGVCTEVLFIEEGGSKKERYSYNGVDVIKCPIKAPTVCDKLLPTSLNAADSRNISDIIFGNYDIVSFHFGGSRIKRCIINICRRARIPFVIHFHGLNVWYEQEEKYRLLYEWYRFQYRSLYKRADAAVGVSRKVCKIFSDRIGSVPAYTVYNGVDIDRFIYDDKSVLPSAVRLLCVANLITLKGQDLLLEAAAKLIASGVDCRLTLVGDGGNRGALEGLAERLGIAEKVVFTGALEYGRVAEIMGENDIFVMPSFFEALGCVYLEAMARGMLTVGVKYQGIAEIINDGENGFLLEPKSAESIAATVDRIIALSPEERADISREARKTAQRYTWEDSARSLKQVYEKTVSLFREEKA